MAYSEICGSVEGSVVKSKSDASISGKDSHSLKEDSVCDGASSHLDFELESVGENATNNSDFTAVSGSQVKSDIYQDGNAKVNKPNSYEEILDEKTDENLQKKMQDLIKGRLLARHGIFSAHELTDETLFSACGKITDRHGSKRYHSMDTQYGNINDIGSSDRHCILRLPEFAAELVRKRIQDNEDIGMTIEPTGRYDYREYKICIKDLDKPLIGILVELPCILEAHKTLDCDLLFKAADISQMMVAYDEDTAAQVAEQLKEQRVWEWPDGITPATKNIRARKFKNFEVYSSEDIKEAENEALILLSGLIRDSYHFEVKSAQEVLELVESYRNGNIKERIIGPDEDVDDYIAALEEQENEFVGELSEIMFSGDTVAFRTNSTKINDTKR